jgi:predicted DNA binding protein
MSVKDNLDGATTGPPIFVDVLLDHPILRTSLRRTPGMRIEWLQNDAVGDGRQLLLRARDGDFAAFEAALDDDSTIEMVDPPAGSGRRRLYRLDLVDEGLDADLYPVLAGTGSVVEGATITCEGWQCQFYFPDRDALRRFVEACRERDIGMDIDRLTERHGFGAPAFGLTGAQREALVTAAAEGWFEIPREISLKRLADRLDVSDTAASERLRRATKTLVEHTVGSGPER